jgi:hypothetical protein
MRFLIVISALLFMVGCGGEPVKPKLMKDMADFDRAYIPALIFTDLHRQRESELSLERVKGNWKTFSDKYYELEFKYGVDIVDKFWKEDFEKIEDLLVTSEGYVKAEKLAEAHLELDKIRFVFKRLRHRNGLPYFLDGMNEFDTEMEEILDFIKGKPRLDEREVEKLRNLAVDAREKWTKVLSAEVSADVFGFDDKKVAAIKKRVKAQDEVLREFEVALWSDDENAIFQTAQDVQPNFVVLYKAFGDFKPVFDQIIKERKP